MAKYNYKCINGHCKENNVLKVITKPMNDGGKEEFCEVCGQALSKIYGSVGISTFGDGYKS